MLISVRGWLLFAILSAFLRCLPGQVTAYHNVSSATHQANFNTLSGQGYRIVSLSVAGTLAAPRYSAVWEQVFGSAWVASHDMSASQYATTQATWVNQGYRAKIITAAGAGTNRVYAAVFVHDGVIPHAGTVYAWSTFATVCDNERGAGYIPVCADVYGDASGHYVCAVFEPNVAGKVWGFDLDDTYTDFSTTRLAHGEGGERLACLGMSDDQRYVSVWYDERVGIETIAVNQTGTGWQNVFNAATGNGWYPRLIASGGSGAALRFAGSFAEYRFPQSRVPTVTGTFRSQFAAFDTYMANLLATEGARAGALAIAKDGKLVYARAFTRAEAGYPITQPTDAFRIASCTKPLTAIATHQLDEMGLVTMATKPQSVLALPYVGTWFDDVELRHILEYTSGIDRNYDPWTVALAVSPSPTLPQNLVNGTHWLAQHPMLFAPTTPASYYSYSNAAFMLPAEVIRVRSGSSYMSFLQNEVLGPLGITRIRVAPSEYGQLTVSDVRHHLTELRLDPSELYIDRRRRSAQYAEDLNFKRASGGLASSAIDYVRVLSGVFDLRGADAIVLNSTTVDGMLARHVYPKFSAPSSNQNICLAAMSWADLGGGVYAYKKGGSLENASTVVAWRTDGVSFAAFINKGESAADTTTLLSMIDNVTNWPDVDEFPTYGLPAFPRRAQIQLVLPSSLVNVTSSSFALTGSRFDTVTQVTFGSHTITSTDPADWQSGYFVVTSPISIQVHPPQGLIAATYPVSVSNAAGASNSVNVAMTLNTTFRMGAPTVVHANQPWSAYIARGTASGLTHTGGFGILCISFGNSPSVVPGIVDLGLGNQFADLVTSGAFQFSPLTNVHRFDLPPLPNGTVFLETIGFDVTAPSLFPLLSTNTTATMRL